MVNKAKPAAGVPPAPPAASAFSSARLLYFLLPLAVFVLLSGVLRNGFVNWDDDFTLQLNPAYRGLSWAHLKWMFTTFHMGHYQPLSWLTFAFDYKVWGLDPQGYHLTSLLLHCGNAVLFYHAARRLFARLPAGAGATWVCAPAAAFSALFFALHPLRVESVAWATERRDVLSGFFLLLSVCVYLEAAAAGPLLSARALAASCACYLLSLLSKGIGVTLPAVLLLLDFYPLRRHASATARQLLLEKIPYAALSLAAGITGLVAAVGTGASSFLNIGDSPTLPERLLQALYAAAFYFWKTLLPFGLLPLYERPFHIGGQPWYVHAGAAFALAAAAAALLLRRRWPGAAAAWAAFLLMLVPVAQLVPLGPYLAADRYTYLACLPFALLAGGLFARALLAYRPAFVLAAGAALLLALGLLSGRQARHWKDPETLWRRVLAGNPSSSIAHSNLGSILLDAQGKTGEAAAHFRQALASRPDYPFANYNYGNALAAQGRLEEAMEYYRRTVRLMPGYANAHFNLGNMLIRSGRPGEAAAAYRETLRLDPGYANAHNNLAVALLSLGERETARRHLLEALRLDPGHALARKTLEGLGGGEEVK